MKNFLNKIMRGVFASSLLLLIFCGCEDNLFNVDDRINANDLINADNLNGINAGDFLDDYLLYCTFEGDAIPGQPNKTLPGVPSGDELIYANGTGIIVLYSAQQKSIILPYPQPDEEFEKIEFVSKPGSNDGILTFSWAGQTSGHFTQDNPNDNKPVGNSAGFKRVTLTNGADTLVNLQIEFNSFMMVHDVPNSNIHVLHGGATHLFPLQPGPSPNIWIPSTTQHKFIITCNLQTQTYDVKFIREGGTTITIDDRPFFEPYTPIRDPRFRIRMVVPKALHPNGYILDMATIRQTQPLTYPGPLPDF